MKLENLRLASGSSSDLGSLFEGRVMKELQTGHGQTQIHRQVSWGRDGANPLQS